MVDILRRSQEAIDAVQSLIAFNVECADGYREAADHVMGHRLEAMFRDEARLHDEFAHALKAALLVRTGHGDAVVSAQSPDEESSRWWQVIRRFNLPQEGQAIHAEAERGLEVVKRRYEDLHQWPMGSPLAELLTHQYRVIGYSLERMRGGRVFADSPTEMR